MEYKIMNKEEIYTLINEQASRLSVIKNKKHTDKWTVNELIYCLEYIDYETTTYLTIQLDSTSIPISGGSPVFVPTDIRGKSVKIVDAEVYNISCDVSDIDEEYVEGERPVYIIVVEEVK
jgi:hypothetical protein